MKREISAWRSIMNSISNDIRRRKFVLRYDFWATWDVDRKKNYANPARIGFRSGYVAKWKEIDDFVRYKKRQG